MTDWDKKIISDMQATIDRLTVRITGLANTDMVRDTVGDSSMRTVAEHKATIAQNIKWIEEVRSNPSS